MHLKGCRLHSCRSRTGQRSFTLDGQLGHRNSLSAMGLETAPAEAVLTVSSKTSPLRWMTAGSPTNYNMLLFRTMNKEMGQPNANEDNLAPLLRDKLMPVRMWCMKNIPGAMKMFKNGLEHPKLGVPGVLNFVDARTSWFDSVVKDALAKHNISQVVVVAAGFDTRAYRIGAKYKDVHFFEVDLPHASQKKQQLVNELLQPEATFPRPTFLAADLATKSLDTVLLGTSSSSSSSSTSTAAAAAAAFDPTKPTLFTVEGLIYYLPQDAVRQLFAAMCKVAAPGSRVAFDFLHKEVLDGSVPLPPAYKVTATSVANKGEPFISGIQDSKEAVQAFLDSVLSSGTTHPTITIDADTDGMAPAGDSEGADGVATADAAAAAGVGGAKLGWRVVDYMGPKEAVARQLPHLEWNDAIPPMLSFYSFAAAELVAAE